MPPDADRLLATVEHLAAFDRPSASEGERRAAEWIREQLDGLGAAARVEEEPAHGTYWVPLGLMTRGGGPGRAGGALAPRPRARRARRRRGRRRGGRRRLRRPARVPPRCSGTARPTTSWARRATPRRARTLVFLAHHDAAHGGLIFSQALVTTPADAFPGWFERQETSPQVMAVVAGGPALVALGAVLRLRRAAQGGTAISLASAAAFADIASRSVVPGANDNLSGVAVLLELARALRDEPVRGVRVLLVSTGSEESFMEGMRGFARRHFPGLPRESTEVVCLDSVGSPELVLIEGEGMLRMRDYTPELRDRLAALAARAGIHLRRGLRLGLATDGLIALKAGYRSAALGSVTRYKLPSNYHSQRDTPANLHLATVRDAAALCEALVRDSGGLDELRARRRASSRVAISPA